VSDTIRVVDGCLPPNIYDDLARFVAGTPMEYGSRSKPRDDHGHWINQFIAAGPENLADVSAILTNTPQYQPLDAAWRFLHEAHLSDSVLIRCYLNGYTYGTDGYFHTDSQRADQQTTILFMNEEEWQPDWAGETVFLDQNGDILRSVLPRKNRAILFPGDVPHAGRGVSRQCPLLRKTLIYKVRKKRSPVFENLSTFLINNGANRHIHKRGSVHDHLMRTFAILEARGCPAEVCLGAALHALYDTNLFAANTDTHATRPKVAAAFGARAEELAYLLSVLVRPQTLEAPSELSPETALVETRDGQKIPLPRSTFDNLRRIECASLEDQNMLAGNGALRRFWSEHAPTTPLPATIYL
jgi:hypothetical protein